MYWSNRKGNYFIYLSKLIERMKLNHGILIFDIKGNEHLAVKSLAKEAGRLDDVLEIGKPKGKKFKHQELNETTVNELKIYKWVTMVVQMLIFIMQLKL